MYSCAVCGCNQSRTDLVDEVFKVEGEYVLVEGIPAEVCTRCGEQSVSLETAETVRRAVKEAAPKRAVQMLVFDFASTETIQSADVVIP